MGHAPVNEVVPVESVVLVVEVEVRQVRVLHVPRPMVLHAPRYAIPGVWMRRPYN